MKKLLFKTLAVLLCVIAAVPQMVRAEDTADETAITNEEMNDLYYEEVELTPLENAVDYPTAMYNWATKNYMGCTRQDFINSGYGNVPEAWCVWFINQLAKDVGAGSVFYDVNVTTTFFEKMTNPNGPYKAQGFKTQHAGNYSCFQYAQLVSTSTFVPQKGDILCIKDSNHPQIAHVTFVYDFDGTYVYFIDGNGGTAKPTRVRAHKYNKNSNTSDVSIVGYIRPNYSALDSGSTSISLPAPISSASSVQAKSNIINYAISLVGWNRETFASAGCSDIPSGDWCTWFLKLCASRTGTENLFSASDGVSGFCADMIRNYGAQGFYYTDSSYLTEADRQVLSGAQAVTKSTFSPQVGDIYILHESGFGDLSQVGFVADVVNGSIYAVVGNNGTAKEVQLRNSPTNTFYQIANNACPVVGYIRPNYGALDRIQLNGITLNTTQLTMQIGEQSALTVNYNPSNTTDSKTVTWSSSNTNVVSVSNGTVVANGAGNAVITAACNGKTAVCSVTVRSKDTPSVPVTPEVNANVTSFVNRLYSLVLNRTADSQGLNSWTNALVGRTSSGIDIGYGFVFSPECINRNLSNDAFVEMLYQTFMNRGSDAGGKAAWVSQLDAGVGREKVFEGFVMSAEFANICSQYNINVGTKDSVGAFAAALNQYRNRNADVTKFVARCYTQALERGYETAGLEDWCRVILQKSNTPKQVAQNFIFSAEFAQKGLSDEEYVKVLYRTFMEREADAEGLAAWVNVLKSGREDREKVLEGFSDSVEFDGILQTFGLN